MQTKRIKSEGTGGKTAKAATRVKAPVRDIVANGSAKPATAPKKKVPTQKRKTVASIAPEEIALRAYFLAEKRIAAGLPGDALSDWVEAERQLIVEKQKR